MNQRKFGADAGPAKGASDSGCQARQLLDLPAALFRWRVHWFHRLACSHGRSVQKVARPVYSIGRTAGLAAGVALAAINGQKE